MIDDTCPVIANLVLCLRAENQALRSLNDELRGVIRQLTAERDGTREAWAIADASRSLAGRLGLMMEDSR